MPESPQIVAIGGLPGCGKTSQVQPYLDRGFTRLNRDQFAGNSAVPLLADTSSPYFDEMRRLHADGVRLFVLDNTYCFPKHRDALVAVAKELGLPVHLKMLDVDVPQAQLFAARRQMQRYGKLFTKEDYKASDDPNMFPPTVQFTFNKQLQAKLPSTDEGFASVEFVKVETVWGPEYTGKAVFLDLDGTVRDTNSGAIYPSDPDDVFILPGVKDKLAAMKAEGYLLFGVSNQSGPARKTNDPKYVSKAKVEACIQRTKDLLGIEFDVMYAPDRGGPPSTYWRKPCPGLGVVFVEQHKLDPAKCVMVGDMKSDRTFAERCGFQFQWAKDFFGW